MARQTRGARASARQQQQQQQQLAPESSQQLPEQHPQEEEEEQQQQQAAAGTSNKGRKRTRAEAEQEQQQQHQQEEEPQHECSSEEGRRREHSRGSSRRANGSPSPSTKAADEEATSASGSEEEDEVKALEPELPELSLQVLWTSVSGRTKLTQLPLVMMQRWDCTSGLHKRLVARVFGDSERPASLTCAQYMQFNTSEECLNYPLDIARTSFRLVASHEGWQYVIHESPQHPPGVPPDFIHVVSIEFETVARVIGHLGIRMSMIAYPIVAINKAKLMEVVGRMRGDPLFKGILS